MIVQKKEFLILTQKLQEFWYLGLYSQKPLYTILDCYVTFKAQINTLNRFYLNNLEEKARN